MKMEKGEISFSLLSVCPLLFPSEPRSGALLCSHIVSHPQRLSLPHCFFYGFAGLCFCGKLLRSRIFKATGIDEVAFASMGCFFV